MISDKYRPNVTAQHPSRILFAFTIVTAILCAASGLAFEQIIKETNKIALLDVKISHNKGIFWQATIHNRDRQLPISILWDKSSYTSSSGRSSRLVRPQQTDIHPSDGQMPTPLAAQTDVNLLFTSEDLLPYADREVLPTPSNPTAQGVLKLAFKKNGLLHFWKGSVQFKNIDKKESR